MQVMPISDFTSLHTLLRFSFIFRFIFHRMSRKSKFSEVASEKEERKKEKKTLSVIEFGKS